MKNSLDRNKPENNDNEDIDCYIASDLEDDEEPDFNEFFSFDFNVLLEFSVFFF